jgi:hypothetical protein
MDGMLIGLTAAIVSTLTLLAVSALAGHGGDILADVATAVLPAALRAVIGTPPAISYLLSHTVLYVMAGVAVLTLARLADRVPAFMTGVVLLGIIFEFGFLVLTTEDRTMARFGDFTWRALLIAHAMGDLAFVLALVRIHPAIRQALVRGYTE